MNGLRWYYAKLNKSEKGIPYESMCGNLKSKTRLRYGESIGGCQRQGVKARQNG